METLLAGLEDSAVLRTLPFGLLNRRACGFVNARLNPSPSLRISDTRRALCKITKGGEINEPDL